MNKATHLFCVAGGCYSKQNDPVIRGVNLSLSTVINITIFFFNRYTVASILSGVINLNLNAKT